MQRMSLAEYPAENIETFDAALSHQVESKMFSNHREFDDDDN